jgi:beta-xylosidase
VRYLDEYFLYQTTDDGDSGISVHRSRDLVHWELAGYALEGGGADWAQTRPLGTGGHVLARRLPHLLRRHRLRNGRPG